jgi:malate dehydrogenase (oxaloacetate-decarboxylating)(NADP+)
MKTAATHALAALAREVVPEYVLRAYGLDQLKFGPDYIIPKPNDYRALEWVASAVAQAAMESGVARTSVDITEYRERLRGIQQPGRRVIHSIVEKARRNPKRLVFSEGEHPTTINAASLFQQEGFGTPILVGRETVIRSLIGGLGLSFTPEVVDPLHSDRVDTYARQIYDARQRKGVTLDKAIEIARDPTVYGLMMVREGQADALLSGLTHEYPAVLRPILQHIPLRAGLSVAAGVFIVINNGQVHFFADSLVNIEPGPQELAEIAILTADFARDFDIEPRVAMVSFSNFGASNHPAARKVRQSVNIVRERRPDIQIDGELQADVAISRDIVAKRYPFSQVSGANVLVFPNLDASLAAFKVVSQLGGAYAIGPVLLGPTRSAHVVQPTMDPQSIVLMGAMAVVEAQERERAKIADHPAALVRAGE